MRRMEETVRVRLRRVRLRKVIRDRSNPFEDLAEEEFLQRFRLTKECVLNLLQNIRGHLPIAADARGCPIPQHLQLLITLRCMATGGHQLTISDCYQVSQTSISRCIWTVTPIIAQMAKDYVKMPTGMNAIRVMEGFLEIARMPGIVGAIDCTIHIHFLRPACENPELYHNRKGIFSLNCQAVCGPDLTFFNIVARWWGSAHDSNIFNNSLLRHEFEQGMHKGKLLGDMGYPCRSYLFTPLMNPSNQSETAYNEAHIKTRNKIECAFGVLKRRFSCLGKRLYTALDTTKKHYCSSSCATYFCNSE
ncbi:putative nuclease HARBI1 [Scylla paramamosain]|uniref:putative nuclease HARBI1 n=1 Tax=Scylla paramamosain TaxID=85552 RepID=UPI003083357F